ncbi:hypothetical protein ACXZ1M_13370 [Duganella sp. PWIR1]
MATDFVVHRGSPVTLDANSVIELYYNRFVLQSGAKLILKRLSSDFKVGELIIEDDVEILGAGKSGVHGPDGVSDKVQAGIGDGGWPGNPGGHGTNGSPGSSIAITAVSMHAIGRNFQVDLRGGDGGHGGHGGNGGMGGNAGCPQKGGDGGPGGDGGNGGDGGPGGKFIVTASSYIPGGALPEPTPDLFLVKGGAGGRGGQPGSGGHGGDATTCGPWGTLQVDGGGPGGSGRPGKRGRGGETHRPVIVGV